MEPGSRLEVNAAGLRREPVLLKARPGPRRDQTGALGDDEQFVARHCVAGARLVAWNVRDDEAPHGHEGEPALDFDDAHAAALVGVLVELHEGQTLVGHMAGNAS
jgi:hypothetical protein